MGEASLWGRLLRLLQRTLRDAAVASLRRVVVGTVLKHLSRQQLGVAVRGAEICFSSVEIETESINRSLQAAGWGSLSVVRCIIERVSLKLPLSLKIYKPSIAIRVQGTSPWADPQPGPVQQRPQQPQSSGGLQQPTPQSGGPVRTHRRTERTLGHKAGDCHLGEHPTTTTRNFESKAAGFTPAAARSTAIPAAGRDSSRGTRVPRRGFRRGWTSCASELPTSGGFLGARVDEYGGASSVTAEEGLQRAPSPMVASPDAASYHMAPLLSLLRRALQSAAGAADVSVECLSICLFKEGEKGVPFCAASNLGELQEMGASIDNSQGSPSFEGPSSSQLHRARRTAASCRRGSLSRTPSVSLPSDRSVGRKLTHGASVGAADDAVAAGRAPSARDVGGERESPSTLWALRLQIECIRGSDSSGGGAQLRLEGLLVSLLPSFPVSVLVNGDTALWRKAPGLLLLSTRSPDVHRDSPSALKENLHSGVSYRACATSETRDTETRGEAEAVAEDSQITGRVWLQSCLHSITATQTEDHTAACLSLLQQQQRMYGGALTSPSAAAAAAAQAAAAAAAAGEGTLSASHREAWRRPPSRAPLSVSLARDTSSSSRPETSAAAAAAAAAGADGWSVSGSSECGCGLSCCCGGLNGRCSRCCCCNGGGEETVFDFGISLSIPLVFVVAGGEHLRVLRLIADGLGPSQGPLAPSGGSSTMNCSRYSKAPRSTSRDSSCSIKSASLIPDLSPSPEAALRVARGAANAATAAAAVVAIKSAAAPRTTATETATIAAAGEATHISQRRSSSSHRQISSSNSSSGRSGSPSSIGRGPPVSTRGLRGDEADTVGDFAAHDEFSDDVGAFDIELQEPLGNSLDSSIAGALQKPIRGPIGIEGPLQGLKKRSVGWLQYFGLPGNREAIPLSVEGISGPAEASVVGSISAPSEMPLGGEVLSMPYEDGDQQRQQPGVSEATASAGASGVAADVCRPPQAGQPGPSKDSSQKGRCSKQKTLTGQQQHHELRQQHEGQQQEQQQQYEKRRDRQQQQQRQRPQPGGRKVAAVAAAAPAPCPSSDSSGPAQVLSAAAAEAAVATAGAEAAAAAAAPRVSCAISVCVQTVALHIAASNTFGPLIVPEFFGALVDDGGAPPIEHHGNPPEPPQEFVTIGQQRQQQKKLNKASSGNNSCGASEPEGQGASTCDKSTCALVSRAFPASLLYVPAPRSHLLSLCVSALSATVILPHGSSSNKTLAAAAEASNSFSASSPITLLKASSPTAAAIVRHQPLSVITPSKSVGGRDPPSQQHQQQPLYSVQCVVDFGQWVLQLSQLQTSGTARTTRGSQGISQGPLFGLQSCLERLYASVQTEDQQQQKQRCLFPEAVAIARAATAGADSVQVGSSGAAAVAAALPVDDNAPVSPDSSRSSSNSRIFSSSSSTSRKSSNSRTTTITKETKPQIGSLPEVAAAAAAAAAAAKSSWGSQGKLPCKYSIGDVAAAISRPSARVNSSSSPLAPEIAVEEIRTVPPLLPCVADAERTAKARSSNTRTLGRGRTPGNSRTSSTQLRQKGDPGVRPPAGHVASPAAANGAAAAEAAAAGAGDSDEPHIYAANDEDSLLAIRVEAAAKEAIAPALGTTGPSAATESAGAGLVGRRRRGKQPKLKDSGTEKPSALVAPASAAAATKEGKEDEQQHEGGLSAIGSGGSSTSFLTPQCSGSPRDFFPIEAVAADEAKAAAAAESEAEEEEAAASDVAVTEGAERGKDTEMIWRAPRHTTDEEKCEDPGLGGEVLGPSCACVCVNTYSQLRQRQKRQGVNSGVEAASAQSDARTTVDGPASSSPLCHPLGVEFPQAAAVSDSSNGSCGSYLLLNNNSSSSSGSCSRWKLLLPSLETLLQAVGASAGREAPGEPCCSYRTHVLLFGAKEETLEPKCLEEAPGDAKKRHDSRRLRRSRRRRCAYSSHSSSCRGSSGRSSDRISSVSSRDSSCMVRRFKRTGGRQHRGLTSVESSCDDGSELDRGWGSPHVEESDFSGGASKVYNGLLRRDRQGHNSSSVGGFWYLKVPTAPGLEVPETLLLAPLCTPPPFSTACHTETATAAGASAAVCTAPSMTPNTKPRKTPATAHSQKFSAQVCRGSSKGLHVGPPTINIRAGYFFVPIPPSSATASVLECTDTSRDHRPFHDPQSSSRAPSAAAAETTGGLNATDAPDVVGATTYRRGVPEAPEQVAAAPITAADAASAAPAACVEAKLEAVVAHLPVRCLGTLAELCETVSSALLSPFRSSAADAPAVSSITAVAQSQQRPSTVSFPLFLLLSAPCLRLHIEAADTLEAAAPKPAAATERDQQQQHRRGSDELAVKGSSTKSSSSTSNCTGDGKSCSSITAIVDICSLVVSYSPGPTLGLTPGSDSSINRSTCNSSLSSSSNFIDASASPRLCEASLLLQQHLRCFLLYRQQEPHQQRRHRHQNQQQQWICRLLLNTCVPSNPLESSSVGLRGVPIGGPQLLLPLRAILMTPAPSFSYVCAAAISSPEAAVAAATEDRNLPTSAESNELQRQQASLQQQQGQQQHQRNVSETLSILVPFAAVSLQSDAAKPLGSFINCVTLFLAASREEDSQHCVEVPTGTTPLHVSSMHRQMQEVQHVQHHQLNQPFWARLLYRPGSRFNVSVGALSVDCRTTKSNCNPSSSNGHCKYTSRPGGSPAPALAEEGGCCCSSCMTGVYVELGRLSFCLSCLPPVKVSAAAAATAAAATAAAATAAAAGSSNRVLCSLSLGSIAAFCCSMPVLYTWRASLFHSCSTPRGVEGAQTAGSTTADAVNRDRTAAFGAAPCEGESFLTQRRDRVLSVCFEANSSIGSREIDLTVAKADVSMECLVAVCSISAVQGATAALQILFQCASAAVAKPSSTAVKQKQQLQQRQTHKQLQPDELTVSLGSCQVSCSVSESLLLLPRPSEWLQGSTAATGATATKAAIAEAATTEAEDLLEGAGWLAVLYVSAVRAELHTHRQHRTQQMGVQGPQQQHHQDSAAHAVAVQAAQPAAAEVQGHCLSLECAAVELHLIDEATRLCFASQEGGVSLQQLSSVPLPSPFLQRPFASTATEDRASQPVGREMGPRGSGVELGCRSCSSSCFCESVSTGRERQSRQNSHGSRSAARVSTAATTGKGGTLPALIFRADAAVSLLPFCGLARLFAAEGLGLSLGASLQQQQQEAFTTTAVAAAGENTRRGLLRCRGFQGVLCPDSLRCLLVLFADMGALMSLPEGPSDFLAADKALKALFAVCSSSSSSGSGKTIEKKRSLTSPSRMPSATQPLDRSDISGGLKGTGKGPLAQRRETSKLPSTDTSTTLKEGSSEGGALPVNILSELDVGAFLVDSDVGGALVRGSLRTGEVPGAPLSSFMSSYPEVAVPAFGEPLTETLVENATKTESQAGATGDMHFALIRDYVAAPPKSAPAVHGSQKASRSQEAVATGATATPTTVGRSPAENLRAALVAASAAGTAAAAAAAGVEGDSESSEDAWEAAVELSGAHTAPTRRGTPRRGPCNQACPTAAELKQMKETDDAVRMLVADLYKDGGVPIRSAPCRVPEGLTGEGCTAEPSSVGHGDNRSWSTDIKRPKGKVGNQCLAVTVEDHFGLSPGTGSSEAPQCVSSESSQLLGDCKGSLGAPCWDSSSLLRAPPANPEAGPWGPVLRQQAHQNGAAERPSPFWGSLLEVRVDSAGIVVSGNSHFSETGTPVSDAYRAKLLRLCLDNVTAVLATTTSSCSSTQKGGLLRFVGASVGDLSIEDFVEGSSFSFIARYYKNEMERPRPSSLPMLFLSVSEFALPSQKQHQQQQELEYEVEAKLLPFAVSLHQRTVDAFEHFIHQFLMAGAVMLPASHILSASETGSAKSDSTNGGPSNMRRGGLRDLPTPSRRRNRQLHTSSASSRSLTAKVKQYYRHQDRQHPWQQQRKRRQRHRKQKIAAKADFSWNPPAAAVKAFDSLGDPTDNAFRLRHHSRMAFGSKCSSSSGNSSSISSSANSSDCSGLVDSRQPSTSAFALLRIPRAAGSSQLCLESSDRGGAPQVGSEASSSVVFIRLFRLSAVLFRLDFEPRQPKAENICRGDLREALNLLAACCRFEGIEFALPPQLLCDVSSLGALAAKLSEQCISAVSRAVILRCMNSVAPVSRLLWGSRTLRSWCLRNLKKPRIWWARARGGSSRLAATAGGTAVTRRRGGPFTPRAVAALQQLLSSSSTPDVQGLLLLLARTAAATAAAAGIEGLCLSERALRGFHALLFWLDCTYSPGSCPPYPSTTCRTRGNRGSDILLLLQQQHIQQQQRQRSGSSTRAAAASTQSSSRRRRAAAAASQASSEWASSAELSALSFGDRLDAGEGGPSEWSVVHLGADGLYEPEGLLSGLNDACRCVSRGVSSANEVLRRLYSPNPTGPDVLQLAGRVLPALVLRPMLGFTEGCTMAVQGARNQLAPLARAERLAIARQPRVDDGVFIPSDEDDDMLIG